MPAGKLRVTLDVEVNTPTRDGAGQQIEKWERVRQADFSIMPAAGNEGPRGLQIEATTTHVLRCRWFAGASPKMRLRRGTRVFHVERVSNWEERNRWLDWTAREVSQ